MGVYVILMNRGDVPDNDHIVRYVPAAQIFTDDSVDSSNFRPRDLGGKPETYVSVNWVEYHNPKISDGVKDIRPLNKRIKGCSDDSALALLNVGCSIQYVYQSTNRRLDIYHHWNVNNPSHSGIHNLKLNDDDLIFESICETIIFLCKDFPAASE